MSAYISLLTPAGGYLFTDGAAWDEQGVVREIVKKADCATRAPFAVTTLGNSVLGEKFKSGLVQMADRFGVDEMIEHGIPAMLEPFRSSPDWREMTAGKGNTCVHMVAFSEMKGLIHFNFQTMDEQDDGRLIEAYKLRILDKPFTGRGAIVSVNADGIRQASPGEDIDAYIRYFGKEVLERMRSVKGRSMHLNGTDAPRHHSVGGHIDLTIVNRMSARTERIHVWDDKIGEKIRPKQKAETVTQFDGMNRHQRRAAERDQRKRAG